MATGMPFHRTESLAQSFMIMVLTVTLFFAAIISGFYFSSRDALRELGYHNQINQIYDTARQIEKLQGSYREITQSLVAGGDFKQSRSVLKMASDQEGQLFKKALQLSASDPRVYALFLEASEASHNLKATLDKTLSREGDLATGRLFIKQFDLEVSDTLSKVQILLKAKSDESFLRIYERRLDPLILGTVLTFIFMGISSTIGLKLVRRFKSGVSGLLDATTQVAGGNLSYRTPILRPDEVGQLTHAFNQMTQTLQESTVSRHTIENIIESMLDSLILIDRHGLIQQVNRETVRVFGYSPEELIGQSYKILFAEAIDLAPSQQERETECVAKSGRRVPVSLKVSALFGHSQDLVCVIHDITERKRAEDELRSRNLDLAAANKELEAFSYSVSHDLRAPLRGIDGFSQALIEDIGQELNDEDRDYLHRIRAGVQRMGKLIDDMLGLSKLSRKEMSLKSVDISAIAQDIFSELKRTEPNRQAELVIKGNLNVIADPDLVRILLENLIGNAWKYTSKRPSTKIEIGVTVHDEHKMFYIKDNGAGFDMAYSQKLFGAFQRLHRSDEFPGTGIGLATAQRIVHRHGGTICAEAALDKGATFYFAL